MEKKGEKEMLRDKFNKILENHGIFCEDAEEILLAVSDMLNCAADDTEEKYPYATRTIADLEKAAHEVFEISCQLDDEE